MPARTWLFDVDGTLIDSLTGTSLRPGTAALLEAVRGAGGTVVVWSAGGAPYSEARAQAHGIGHLIDRYEAKDVRDPAGRYVHPDGLDLAHVVFVDDRPEDMPIGASVVEVFPYLADNPHDRAFPRLVDQLASGVDTTRTA